ncbi:MAG: hypothetical protein IJJ78_07740 [Paludibacteraceae bacterium]|nr:hypothetical protein [Paludibacteraceae bacterium]MBR0498955.1 hypothetical protein [Paludibacteraceae bacterium]
MKTKFTIALLTATMTFSLGVFAQGRGGSSSSNSAGTSVRSSNSSTSSTLRSSSGSSNSGSSVRAGSSLRSSVTTATPRSSSGSSVSSGTSSRNGNSYRSSGGNSGNTTVINNTVVNNAPRNDANMPKYKDRRVKSYPRSESRTVAHHYPRHIDRIDRHVHIVHSGVDYYYRDGLYYRFLGGRYVIAPAPRYIRVRTIPASYFSFRIGSLAYYYSLGTYYHYDPVTLTYEVVAPPMGAIVPELPEYDVNTVVINNKTYLEYDGTLYKPMITSDGVLYKVMGRFEDIVR